MILFRQLRNRSLILWVLLLSIAVISAQGSVLHVHNFGSDHDSRDSIAPEIAAQHSHQHGVHLAKDISHYDHHDEVIAEIDTNHQALLKKSSSNNTILAILIVMITLLVYRFYMQSIVRRHDDNVTLVLRYLLSPPLRAPPA
ncbi:MAG: hypothetical protein HRT92_00760 [Piscirickettsiaceae bacterium]|nr:hypothetical protein [Piscirickettsiaceae bacterium]